MSDMDKKIIKEFDPQTGQPKKKNGMIIGLVVGVVVLFIFVAIGVYAAQNLLFGGDDDIESAMVNTFTQMDNTSLNDTFGYAELAKNVEENGIQTSFNMKINELGGESLSGSPTVNLETKYDLANSAFDMTVDGSYAGISIEPVEIYADQQYLMMNAPILYDKAFQIDYSGDLADKLSNAPIAKESGLTEEQINQLVVILDTLKQGASNYGIYRDEFEKQLVEIRHEFFTNADIEKVDSEKITLDGKEVKCKGYRITLTPEEISALIHKVVEASNTYQSQFFTEDLTALFDELGVDMSGYLTDDSELLSQIEENIESATFDVYVYQKQVAKLNCEVACVDDTTVDFTYESQGGKQLVENMKCMIQVTEAGMTSKMDLVRTTQDTNDTYHTDFVIEEDNDELMTVEFDYHKKDMTYEIDCNFDDEYRIDCNGTVDELTKGEVISASIDQFVFSEYGINSMIFSGKFSVSSLQDKIVKPEVESIDLLEATTDELNNMIYEVYNNIYQFQTQLY